MSCKSVKGTSLLRFLLSKIYIHVQCLKMRIYIALSGVEKLRYGLLVRKCRIHTDFNHPRSLRDLLLWMTRGGNQKFLTGLL